MFRTLHNLVQQFEPEENLMIVEKKEVDWEALNE